MAEPLDEAADSWLRERARVDSVGAGEPGWPEALAEAEALVVRTYTIVDERLLEAAPRLRVVGRAGVGLDNVDLEACRRRNVRVVHTPAASTPAVAEYVFGLLLDRFRPRPALPRHADSDGFFELRRAAVGDELRGKRIGVVGMGRIGRRVAGLARAFEMDVRWTDLASREELGLDASWGESAGPEDLWAWAEIVTLHVDGRPGNRGFVGEPLLSLLRADGTLVNTARAMVLDRGPFEAWARRAAGEGGRAILDVHDPEPPERDDPLRALDSVVLLPHLGARTRTALAAMSWVVRDVFAALEEMRIG